MFFRQSKAITFKVNTCCATLIQHRTNYNVLGGALIFGDFRPLNKYSQEEKETAGERVGLVLKLCNLLSVQFEVTMENAAEQKRYWQIWVNNMQKQENHMLFEFVKKCQTYTKVTITLDPKLFGYNCFDNDTIEFLFRLICERSFIKQNFAFALNGTNIDVSQCINFKITFLVFSAGLLNNTFNVLKRMRKMMLISMKS